MPWITPLSRALAWQQACERYERVPCDIPCLHYVPPMTYFNTAGTRTPEHISLWDLTFNFKEGYDIKAKREDRKALPPIFENFYAEEEWKVVPTTTQLQYGRPIINQKTLDWLDRRTRVGGVKDFYQRQGVNMQPDLDQQPLH